jgi:hypothetical protein
VTLSTSSSSFDTFYLQLLLEYGMEGLLYYPAYTSTVFKGIVDSCFHVREDFGVVAVVVVNTKI